MKRRDHQPDPAGTVDLHGELPEQALRKVERALHTARLRGLEELLVVTGRGLGNRRQEPLLRSRVERFLDLEGPRLWVSGFRRDPHGGALIVRLRRRPPPPVPGEE